MSDDQRRFLTLRVQLTIKAVITVFVAFMTSCIWARDGARASVIILIPFNLFNVYSVYVLVRQLRGGGKDVQR